MRAILRPQPPNPFALGDRIYPPPGGAILPFFAFSIESANFGQYLRRNGVPRSLLPVDFVVKICEEFPAVVMRAQPTVAQVFPLPAARPITLPIQYASPAFKATPGSTVSDASRP